MKFFLQVYCNFHLCYCQDGLNYSEKKVQISETILATKVRTVEGKSCLFVTFSIDIII